MPKTLTPAQLYQSHVSMAAAESRGLRARTDNLWNRCKNNAAIMAYLFEPMFAGRVREDLEKAAAKRNRGEPQIVVPLTASAAGRILREQRQTKPATPAEMVNAMSSIVLRSPLYAFRVNGKRLGECTVRELRESRVTDIRNARFKELVLAGLPPTAARDADKPIEFFYSGELGAKEVTEFYNQAERDRRAA